MTPNDILVDLAACLCVELSGPMTSDDPNPDHGLCFCGVMPGSEVSLDYMECRSKCGMAWVRLAGAYPASGIGVASEQAANCNVLLGLDIEMGVVRCLPAGRDIKTPPTAAQMLAATERMNEDLLAMRRAVSCCSALDEDYVLGQFVPIGPEGLMVGWTTTVYAAV